MLLMLLMLLLRLLQLLMLLLLLLLRLMLLMRLLLRLSTTPHRPRLHPRILHHPTIQHIALPYRPVIWVRHLTFDIVHKLHPLDHLPKDDVFPVQMGGGLGEDEELGTVGMGSGIGHTEQTGFGMGQGESFVFKRGPFSTVHRIGPGSVLVHNVSPLYHKVFHHTVERNVHVFLVGTQLREIVCGSWSVFGEQADDETADKRGFQEILFGNVQEHKERDR